MYGCFFPSSSSLSTLDTSFTAFVLIICCHTEPYWKPEKDPWYDINYKAFHSMYLKNLKVSIYPDVSNNMQQSIPVYTSFVTTPSLNVVRHFVTEQSYLRRWNNLSLVRNFWTRLKSSSDCITLSFTALSSWIRFRHLQQRFDRRKCKNLFLSTRSILRFSPHCWSTKPADGEYRECNLY